jgi:long-chain fatty acid transport protein
MMLTCTAAAAVLVTAAMGISGQAHASGFAAARFGGEHGNVVTTNPTASYYNPGAMAFSTGTHLYLDGTLALRHATWTHARAATDEVEPAGAEGANFGKATLFNVFGGPMLGATTRLGPLALGASVSVPFGGQAHWGKNDKFAASAMFPLAEDGVQRWHATDGNVAFIYLTGGAALRLGRVGLGISGNVIRGAVGSTQAKTPTGDGTPDLEREGRAVLDVKGWLGSFGVGGMAELVEEQLWLGASYQAQPGLGTMQLDGTLTTIYQGGATPFPATFHQALPDITRVGLRYQPSPVVQVRLHGEFTRWSVLRTQCVGLQDRECAVDPDGAQVSPDGSVLQNLRRKWNDTLAVRAGASHWLASGTELFAGIGLESAAAPDSTLDPGLADATNFAGALGGRFALTPTLFLAASYTHIQYLHRDNTNASQLANAMPPTRRPDGGGLYTQWIGLLNLNVEKQF